MAESPLSPILQALYRGEREEAERLRRQHSDTDVFDAAALGDVERLAEHLDVDPEAVQARSVDGFTPLHYAAYFGGPEATRFLIENGADVEEPSRNMEFAPEARPFTARSRLVTGMLPSSCSKLGRTRTRASMVASLRSWRPSSQATLRSLRC